MSASTEVQGVVELGFEELGALVAGIGNIHRAIAHRAFGASGPGATPARVAHDAVARRVYGGLRLGSRGAGAAASRAAARIEATPLSATPGGALAISVLNGLIGDQLEAEHSALAVPMTLRVEGERTGHAVVFLHGLMETDHSWAFGGREPYGALLARDHECTPVYVRYNTGRHISENGHELAERLDELLAGWEGLERIALVGHSMGGLVARSACHHGGEWTRHVRHIVSLGTPHLGAPLAQGAHWLAGNAARIPETRAFTAWLRRRSAGIRDLRFGSLVDEDWRDRDPDDLRRVACAEVPFLEDATHCFVSATLTRDARHPVGRLLGDILVLAPSATHRAQERFHVAGTHHLALLNHPAVYEQLCGWLTAT